jgi:hypothetical protein
LNLGVFFGDSFNIFSAPTFFPSVPHPYFGLNKLHDEQAIVIAEAIKKKRIIFILADLNYKISNNFLQMHYPAAFTLLNH